MADSNSYFSAKGELLHAVREGDEVIDALVKQEQALRSLGEGADGCVGNGDRIPSLSAIVAPPVRRWSGARWVLSTPSRPVVDALRDNHMLEAH